MYIHIHWFSSVVYQVQVSTVPLFQAHIIHSHKTVVQANSTWHIWWQTCFSSCLFFFTVIFFSIQCYKKIWGNSRLFHMWVYILYVIVKVSIHVVCQFLWASSFLVAFVRWSKHNQHVCWATEDKKVIQECLLWHEAVFVIQKQSQDTIKRVWREIEKPLVPASSLELHYVSGCLTLLWSLRHWVECMTLLCLYASCANEGKQLRTSRFLYHIFKQLHGVHDVLVLQIQR